MPVTLIATAPGGHDILVTHYATAGKAFRLERKATITDATWAAIAGAADQTAAVNGSAVFTDAGAMSLGKAFYRVRALP